MAASDSLGRTLILNVVVALGIAATWCFAAFWLFGVITSATSGARVYEQIFVGLNGEPVITRSSTNRYVAEQTVTLAGEPSSISSQDLLYPQWMTSSLQTRQPLAAPDRSSRLASANDRGAPAIYW